MSQARIYTTKGPVRKEGLVCGKCGAPIRKGIDRRRTFAVGFRGREQTRCMKGECTPTRSELESSALASVYDVIDEIDYDSLHSLEDLQEARDRVVEALNEVASEYESNEMYEINPDLQERVETLESAASELEDWEPENDEPSDETETENCDECQGTGEITEGIEHNPQPCENCEGTGEVEVEDPEAQTLEDWLSEARDSLQQAIDGLEMP